MRLPSRLGDDCDNSSSATFLGKSVGPLELDQLRMSVESNNPARNAYLAM